MIDLELNMMYDASLRLSKFPTTVHFDLWEGECSANLGGDDGIGHCDTAGCRDWGLNCSSKADLLSQNCRGNTYYGRSSSREQIDRMGLTLDYYPPVVKDGHKVATLNPKEIQEESQKWMVSLIGYVVGGGLNLIDYHIWNKAAILKVLWAGFQEGDVVGAMDRPIESGKFMIRKAYKALLLVYPKVRWKKLALGQGLLPRHQFIMWLPLHQRGTDELFSHLFFGCSYSHQMWKSLLCCMQIHRQIGKWRSYGSLLEHIAAMLRMRSYTGYLLPWYIVFG
ncbi:hypothetical protein MTR67_047424 [Solanum verrucosum]|uniref:Reverse transcriptase zinc-binding domain-containing protein n=1 Tax=Solanum verrucosum TaxID=315347 RepID=A0AAF0UYH9_SOLVR|nr:hypothetical protein MTR67_047424 [Solanum verrucosum]